MSRNLTRLAPLAVLVVLAVLPYSTLQIPGLFDGVLNSPGTLQLLALCLVFGGVALSYDLLFGFTGLLSFGHALYFAAGTYVANLALTELGWGLGAALALTTAVGIALPLLVGGVALRVSGIAFSMVTLATAQVGSIVVLRDPGGLTGGEEGLALDRGNVPDVFVGVLNTVNVYWLALAYLAVVYAVVAWVTGSRAGRVWQAIRENERRVEVLGLRPYDFKLVVFVLAGLLAALGGVVHLLLLGGSTPRTTTADFTLGLLVMVVLGGAGSRWGAVLGGVLYTYLDSRLTDLASSPAVQDLPAWLRVPLSEPLFLLGSLFVLVVFFVPGGIAGVVARLRERRSGRRPGDGGLPPGRVVEQLREQVGAGYGGAPRDGV
ncbi:branched-chain amino acid transport system permease protein [Geodermatophilus bullaregiensis]|uniref:branched-chain amino acid ABC transporter permease n=1 Tax=Geodermatophilus bullaregiensis TaxID=1564160 RepID=UPI00195D008E|nr:branched-chain amino acid ABC transporter permease [Geodermatophilus bullaregiensis]MBM7806314.1 branched-chain amino acid transport system permease protein [Geodermatophilus bullaregiensis]